ncbi:DUF3885 domain-containing protein [Mechercharimyces sp. CAU 1602]|uniref:DUF3885 domain-containing protein n=1 Tax=Mechercharimyces sp. CAU 1602 TaxID=2973933 RepID=UPI002161697D|nr:DUF3885 domain-containing protein [Mechercharimyces sp. CAU 1602]MCS1350904.1 DUF3885 domain-containing protein [Mechercharimyces sp. CAU 1602]
MRNLNLDQYLSSSFPSLELKTPLFYNFDIGLRFEMSEEGIKEQVYNRAYTLINELCIPTDELFIIIFLDSWDDYPPEEEEQVIASFQRYANAHVKHVNIDRKKVPYRYSGLYDNDSRTFRYSLQCKVNEVDMEGLLIASANQSFDLEPLLKGDLFILNCSKDIVFHLYDYRGMDIVSKSRDTLISVFTEYNHWLLDFDKDRMNSIYWFN